MGDVVELVSLSDFGKRQWDFAIVGFPDDRGVELNRGRLGAAEGPNAIRKWLYRLVAPENGRRIADLGNLEMTKSIEADHISGTTSIAAALAHANLVIVLGGGHDWGYSPIAALRQGGSVGFLNIDAHLDVRASEHQHSGTSYWRALETCVEGKNAFWYGVQRSATAKLHIDYVEAKGGSIGFAGETRGIIDVAGVAFEQCDAVDISLDMDVFAMSDAPGVSAPQAAGLRHEEVLPALRKCLASPKVRTFGVYETSPANDIEEMTARLAARCVWEALAGGRN
jgi:formiminoglutamase